MLEVHVMLCCAADASEAEAEAEARRLRRLAERKQTSTGAADATSSCTQQSENPKPKNTRKQNNQKKKQPKQMIQLKNNLQLTIDQEGPFQHQQPELDVFDFPARTGDTSLRVESSSSSIVQSEGSLPGHGTTPRQSKQSARLRRLIENGDHELGQNDEAEVRLKRRVNSENHSMRKRSIHITIVFVA